VRSASSATDKLASHACSGAPPSGAQSPATRTASRVGGRLGTKAAGRVALPVGAALELGLASREGVKELQVLASFLIARLRADGHPVDRELVRRATLAIYLEPHRPPDLRAPVHRRTLAVARRWSVDAVPLAGRGQGSRTQARVDAVARLDTARLIHAWRLVGAVEADVVERRRPDGAGPAPSAGPPPAITSPPPGPPPRR
jgi:hypothetical protein